MQDNGFVALPPLPGEAARHGRALSFGSARL